jgi:hypothetical protein
LWSLETLTRRIKRQPAQDGHSAAETAMAPLLFPTFGTEETIPRKLLWFSLVLAFLIANAPPALINAAFLKILELGFNGALLNFLGVTRDAANISGNLTDSIFVPLKDPLFLVCLMVIMYPILFCCFKSKDFWRNLELRKITYFALSLFVGLSILVSPYSYPNGLNSHASGLAGLGTSFGRMSLAPFQEGDPLYSKRLLKPAIAHFMHLHGYMAYYAFSLILTFALIFMVVAFLESRIPADKTPGVDQPSLNAPVRWLIYLSLMTSSFILVDFQWPGYSDSLSFILILLLALVPMNSQARLATVALCVLNHEGIALALVPLILFSFPREERLPAFMVIGLFYGFMVASHGFSLLNWFRGQGAVLDDTGSVWARVIQEPGVFLAGLFFTYKLFWFFLLLIIWTLWHRHDRLALMGLGVITISPVALTLFAWDTTRVAGFGWLGLVIALGLFMKKLSKLHRRYQYAAVSLVCLNVLIPSYNVVIEYTDTLSSYPYPGLYRFFNSVVRHLWS